MSAAIGPTSANDGLSTAWVVWTIWRRKALSFAARILREGLTVLIPLTGTCLKMHDVAENLRAMS